MAGTLYPMTRLAVGLMLLLTLLPTGAGLIAALATGFDVDALSRAVSAPGAGRAVVLTVVTGTVATGLSLFFAHTLVALAVTGGWRHRLTAWSLPLLAMPHLALGIGLALVLAPSGLILRSVSPALTGFDVPPDWPTVRDPYGIGLVLGLTLKETCFLVMALATALSQVPTQSLIRQSATLGYGPMKGWLVAVAPRLQQQIALPTAAVLVYGLGNVDLALTIGPDLPPTYAVVLWRWFLDASPDVQAQAQAGTLVLLVVTMLVLACGALCLRLADTLVARAAFAGRRRRREHVFRKVVTAMAMIGLVLGLLGVLAILLRSAAGPWRFPAVLPSALSLDSWRDALPAVTSTGRTTLGLASVTAVVAVLLCWPAAERMRSNPIGRQRLGRWLFVPLLLPQMTFLFGVQVLLVKANVDGTWLAVAWMHLIFALPYVYGALAPARAALDPRLSHVAATLGCGPWQAWWRVTLPLLLRASLLALALAAAVSMSLYLPTLFAGAGRVTTAATEAAAAAGSGSLRLAAAHAILLTLGPFIAFGLAFAAGAAIFRSRRGMA